MDSMEKLTIKAANEDAGQRLDKTLALRAPDLSRARLQALIEEGCVTEGGQAVTDSSRRLKGGEVFEIVLPPAVEATPRPEKIALDIRYEDEHLLVLNKAPGMVVHPAAGNYDGTLVNALLAHCGSSLSGIGGVARPGIVHRLDKETSGLMVVAKTDAAHRGLSKQLESRTLKRVYHAVVWGVPSPVAGRIETQIGRSASDRKKMAVLSSGGKEAVTDYAVLRAYGLAAALVECRLQTGRTHQIRVHMAHLKHWLVGDPAYGRPSVRRFLVQHKVPPGPAAALTDFPRQALHAAQLEFVHPIGDTRVSVEAPAPADMQALLKALKPLISE